VGVGLILPGEPEYEKARRIWNGMIDKHPSAIVRCAGVSDVIDAVNFARREGLRVAVRGGGHNVAGNAVCDDGMVIDLSRMKGIWVDPKARTVRAQAGVTWEELDRETAAFGLATTGGLISTTGIAGLTLGGGLGVLMRKHGLACDNLLSAEVVPAEGRFLRASERENPDLFWGLRGGGGNFGVVTSFEFRLRPCTQVLAGLVVHPLGQAEDLLKFYRGFTQRAPDELALYVLMGPSPDGVRIAAIYACYAGDLKEGERVLRPLREFDTPLADTVGPLPYWEAQRLFDPGFPPGQNNYWKANFLKGLSDEAIETVVNQFKRAPSPLSAVALEHLGGAVRRAGRGATAFAHRDAEYSLLIIGRWVDAMEAEENIAWARGLWSALQPHSLEGVYVNYLGEEGEQRVRAAYGASYERLVALKEKFDPKNFFGLNQNIKPFPNRA
jgi:FAD/FMN-containing dehydrogenase